MAYQAEAFDALGDPTRRRILELLRDGESSVRELTEHTHVTQPAVSQHLRVLAGAGLVSVRPQGTRRLYRVEPAGLEQVRAWVDSFWDTALDAFVAYAERPADTDPPAAPDAFTDPRHPNARSTE